MLAPSKRHALFEKIALLALEAIDWSRWRHCAVERAPR
jgi:hypothetical protein